MTTFVVHTIEAAPVRSRPLLEGVKQALGFVPNLYGVFAESPAALQGALAIWDAFSHSSLSSVEQQLVMSLEYAAASFNSSTSPGHAGRDSAYNNWYATCCTAHSTARLNGSRPCLALNSSTRNAFPIPLRVRVPTRTSTECKRYEKHFGVNC